MLKIKKPPEGWLEIKEGAVRLKDKIWAPSKDDWLDVDEEVYNYLAFLDALAVEELVRVIRKEII